MHSDTVPCHTCYRVVEPQRERHVDRFTARGGDSCSSSPSSCDPSTSGEYDVVGFGSKGHGIECCASRSYRAAFAQLQQ